MPRRRAVDALVAEYRARLTRALDARIFAMRADQGFGTLMHGRGVAA